MKLPYVPGAGVGSQAGFILGALLGGFILYLAAANRLQVYEQIVGV